MEVVAPDEVEAPAAAEAPVMDKKKLDALAEISVDDLSFDLSTKKKKKKKKTAVEEEAEPAPEPVLVFASLQTFSLLSRWAR